MGIVVALEVVGEGSVGRATEVGTDVEPGTEAGVVVAMEVGSDLEVCVEAEVGAALEVAVGCGALTARIVACTIRLDKSGALERRGEASWVESPLVEELFFDVVEARPVEPEVVLGTVIG